MKNVKTKIRISLRLAGLMACLALFQFASVASASLLYIDSFDYNVGVNNLIGQNGGYGWNGPWNAPTSQAAGDLLLEFSNVQDTSANPPVMTFTPTNSPGGQLTGGSKNALFYSTAQTTTPSDRYIFGCRTLASPLRQTFYFASFIYFPPGNIFGTPSQHTGEGFMYSFSSYTQDLAGAASGPNFGPRCPSQSAAGSGRWYVRENTGTVDGSGNAFVDKPGTGIPGTTAYVVAKFGWNPTTSRYTNCSIWINPDYRSNNVPDCSYNFNLTSGSNITYFFYRGVSTRPPDQFVVDEFRMGTTWDDVLLPTPGIKFLVTPAPGSPVAGSNVTVNIQAVDFNSNVPISNLPRTPLLLSSPGLVQFDADNDGTFGDTAVTITNGSSANILIRDYRAETTTVSVRVNPSLSSIQASGTSAPFTVVAGPFARLQVLAAGDVGAGGTPTGKTGTPWPQQPAQPFPVTVNAVDVFFNQVAGVSDTVHFASSTDPVAVLPVDFALNNGTGSALVTLNTPTSRTVTVADFTDGTKTSDTSSPISLVQSYGLAADDFNYPAGDLAAENGGTGWGGPWFVGLNSSLVSVQVVNTFTAPPRLVYVPPAGGAAIVGGTNAVDIAATGVTSSGRNIFASRTFASPLARPFYAGYLLYIKPGDTFGSTTGEAFVWYQSDNGGSESGPTGPNVGPINIDNFQNREAGGGGVGYPVVGGTAGGAMHYLVVRHNFDTIQNRYVSCDLWVDPSFGSLSTPSSTWTHASSYPNFPWLYFRGVTTGTDAFRISSLKYGAFWSDLVPAAAPTLIDHFQVTTPGSQTAGATFTVTVQAMDASNLPLTGADITNTVTMLSSGSVQYDSNGDGTFGDNTKALVNGVFTITAKDNVAQTVTVQAVAVAEGKTGSNPLTINVGPLAKMQVLVPGETAAPGTPTGKTGTPATEQAGTPFTITMNAVDAFWNVVPTVGHTVTITSSDPDTHKILPTGVPLTSGTANGDVMLLTLPSQTITLTDVTDGSKTANTSPPIPLSAAARSWYGDGGANLWNTSSMNWRIGYTIPALYSDGLDVIFDDNSPYPVVNLALDVRPNSVSVNAVGNYIFNGPGQITGTNSMVINSFGTLTIANSNSFSGGVTLNSGILQLGDGTHAGTIGTGNFRTTLIDPYNPQLLFKEPNPVSSPLVLSNGFSGAGNFVMSFESGAVQLAGGVDDANAMAIVRTNATALFGKSANNAIVGGAGLVNLLIERGGTVKFMNGSQITGSGRYQQIDGTMDMNGFSDDIGMITEGLDPNTFATLTTGIIDNTSSNNATLTVGPGFTSGEVWSYPGRIRNSGTGLLNMTTSGNNTWMMTDPTRTIYTGNTRIMQGSLDLEDPNCLQTSTLEMNTADTGTIQFGTTTPLSSVTLGGLTGGRLLSLVNPSGGKVNLTVGKNNRASTYSGELNDSGLGATLTKIGTNTLTLSGNNTYTGATTVSDGTLLISGQLAGSSSVTVATGATLMGAGTINGPITVQSNGRLAPGNNGIGNLISLGLVTLAAGSSTYMEINRTNATGERVTAASIILGGTLTVTNLGAVLRSGDSFTLFGAPLSGAITATPATLPPLWPGLSWNTSSLNSSGTISVTGTALPAISFGTTAVSGTNLLLSGTGGLAGAPYIIVASTNVALPLASWTQATNGVFGPGGTYSNTIPMAPGVPQRFYKTVVN